MPLTDAIALGTLLITVIALVFAIYAIVKEFSIRSLVKRVADMEAKLDRETASLRVGILVEEICAAYLVDSGSNKVHELQMIKVLLNRLIYASNDEERLSTLLSLNGFANPKHESFFAQLKDFYVSLWNGFEWRSSPISKDFKKEYADTFGEDIEVSANKKVLWRFLH